MQLPRYLSFVATAFVVLHCFLQASMHHVITRPTKGCDTLASQQPPQPVLPEVGGSQMGHRTGLNHDCGLLGPPLPLAG